MVDDQPADVTLEGIVISISDVHYFKRKKKF